MCSYDTAWPCNSFSSFAIKVAEYMSSLEYRQAREASHDYNKQRMKNQQQLSSDKCPSAMDSKNTNGFPEVDQSPRGR